MANSGKTIFEHVVLLMPTETARTIADMVQMVNPDSHVEVAGTMTELAKASESIGHSSLLLSFGTSVIVPPDMLTRLDGNAYNIHAASPEFPGRDPHHFAIYEKAKTYGATLHRMDDTVDSGAILLVKRFDVPAGITSGELLVMANEAAMDLVRSVVPALVRGETIPDANEKWRARKTSRKDFMRLCRINACADEQDVEHTLAAVHHDDHTNAYVDVGGHRFRHEGPIPPEVKADYEAAWSDFTEDAYASMIDAAKTHYRFAFYEKEMADDRHVLWRHDVDFSMHRALRLAEIEHVKGVSSTFFLMLDSIFYNLEDPEVLGCARRIIDLGHQLGLHFTPKSSSRENWTQENLEAGIAQDRDRLAGLLNVDIRAFSCHNPVVGDLITFDAPVIAELINAYGRQFKEGYGYCSDSNGYWRHEPIPQILDKAEHYRLQVLTHPAWWTLTPMPPRARIERCVVGRARNVMRLYDQLLVDMSRENIR